MEKDLAISLPVELKATSQTILFIGLSALAFFTPFFIGHPQLAVGTIVNAGLFLSAIFLPKKYILPAVIFPSLGVLARGVIFGPFTPFLMYFLPFIWLGNLFLIFIFLSLISADKRYGFIIAGGVAGVGKFLLLFLFANIYFKFSVVPAVFLQVMGLNQLATALAGGLIAYLIFKIYGKFVTRG